MSLAKRMLLSLETGSIEEKYSAVAQFRVMRYHLRGREVLAKEIKRYSTKHNLSAVKLGKIIAKL